MLRETNLYIRHLIPRCRLIISISHLHQYQQTISLLVSLRIAFGTWTTLASDNPDSSRFGLIATHQSL